MLTRKKAPRVSLPEIVAIRVGRGKSGATTGPVSRRFTDNLVRCVLAQLGIMQT
jgi:hypothetical protein